MTGRITVIPLAAESLGVRSMCTYVETPDVRALIDPGASLGPRFGLIPHPKEYEYLVKAREKIARFADKADVISISHYHFDHTGPTFTDYMWNLSDLDVIDRIYAKKTVLAKDSRSNINPSQRRRGWILKRTLEHRVKELITADGKEFTFGDTVLRFSNPVPHGEQNTPLGWLLMLTVEYDGQKFVYASDVQGPISDETLKTIIAQHPSLVYVGGPPLYLLDYRISRDTLNHGLMNAAKLAEVTPTVIIDHHLLRAEGWREASKEVFETAKKFSHKVVTAAGYIGEVDDPAESHRKSLYEEDPPSEAFRRWSELSEEKRMSQKPPL